MSNAKVLKVSKFFVSIIIANIYFLFAIFGTFCSMDVSRDTFLSGRIAPAQVITLPDGAGGSMRVGLFAVIDPDVASKTQPGPNTTFNTLNGVSGVSPGAVMIRTARLLRGPGYDCQASLESCYH
jgi:hypothetical protein